MIRVLFFARIREQLGCASVDVPYSGQTETVAALQATLVAEHGDAWGEVLGRDNVISAVNQEMVEAEHPLADGDELAFFPPVTGG